MKDEASLRNHLRYLLEGGGAHVAPDQALKGLPGDLRGRRPEGLPHSPWEILEHLRIAQWDILEFSRTPNHSSPDWPEGYWPSSPEAPENGSWDQSLAAFRSDLEAMVELTQDPGSRLFEAFPWGDGQTLLREALLVADHNAYHLGEMVAVRRLLGAWPRWRGRS